MILTRCRISRYSPSTSQPWPRAQRRPSPTLAGPRQRSQVLPSVKLCEHSPNISNYALFVSRSVTSSRMIPALWSPSVFTAPPPSFATCPSSSHPAPRSTWRSSGRPGSTASPSDPPSLRPRGGTSWTEGQGEWSSRLKEN